MDEYITLSLRRRDVELIQNAVKCYNPLVEDHPIDANNRLTVINRILSDKLAED